VAAVSSAAFWEDLYRSREDGWELNRPAPALEDWLERAGGRAFGPGDETHPSGRAGARPDRRQETRPPARPPQRVAVPGCGRGHDARLLARHGYDVWGFDFADDAIREARTLAGQDGTAVHFEQRDIFTLPAGFAGAFDGIWEYTCFCAIDPARRAEYVSVIHRILKPHARLAACFYPIRAGGGGPPFPVDKDEVRRLLAPDFHIESELTPRSVPNRVGEEWMVIASRTL
jgi:SAM-dependent methyltransferase